MSQAIQDAIEPSKAGKLARTFSRLGWVGFWLQIVLGSLPLILMLYYFVFATSGSITRSGLAVVEYLTLANMLLLLFTIFWSYRYTKLGSQIADPERRPALSYVLKTVSTGLKASSLGMLFSMIVILFEAASLLFFFLKAPQGGIPVVQTGADAAHWVNTVDMVSLMSLILMLFAEVLVLIFSLWLLLRASLSAQEHSQPKEAG